MQGPEQYAAQHRAAVLRRERFRHRLEHMLGWRLFACSRLFRTWYSRYRQRLAFLQAAHWLRRDPYAIWVQEEARVWGTLVESAVHPAPLSVRPTVSILVAVQDPHVPWLEASVASVLAQSYPHWELWLCDGSVQPSNRSALDRYPIRETRIKLTPRLTTPEVTTALNQAVNLASGEWIGLLGQHDTLAASALDEVVRSCQNPSVDLLYSDEDKIDADGYRSAPFFKPDWSPDLCLSSLYACHFGVYRRELMKAVGGFRPEYVDSLEYDLLLRCIEQSERIIHIPRVLYHKRQARRDTSAGQLSPPKENQAMEWPSQRDVHASAKQALNAALNRRGESAVVEDGPLPGTFRVRRQLRGTPLVSIIIPTRDRLDLLRCCIQSIEARTPYRPYEILIIDNGSREPQTLAYLASLSHRVIRDDGPFNFARLNNRAAAFARGEHLVLLNNDTEVITPDWLEALLEHSQRRAVGAVGAQLLYPDGAIQHAGVVLGLRGVVGSAHKYLPATSLGYGAFPRLIRNYSAVSAACLMTRKEVYEEVGGMEEALAVDLNDVDWCLRLRARGYLIVYTPYARLYHYESRSRGYRLPRPEEKQYMLDRWGALIARDPYYNPHLTLDREDFRFDLIRARALVREEKRRALS